MKDRLLAIPPFQAGVGCTTRSQLVLGLHKPGLLSDVDFRQPPSPRACGRSRLCHLWPHGTLPACRRIPYAKVGQGHRWYADE